MNITRQHSVRLAAALDARHGGSPWRNLMTELAARLSDAGAFVIARQLREAVELSEQPGTRAAVDGMLAEAANALGELQVAQAGRTVGHKPHLGDSPTRARDRQMMAELHAAGAATMRAQQQLPDPGLRRAPATVVPTRYSPDSLAVLQDRPGGAVTILVGRDGKDLQALLLEPELATYLLHQLLERARRPQL